MPINEQALPGTGSNGDHRVFSDFFSENNIIQQVAVVHPKNLLFRRQSFFMLHRAQDISKLASTG